MTNSKAYKGESHSKYMKTLAKKIGQKAGNSKAGKWATDQLKKGMNKVNSKDGQNAMKALAGGTLTYTLLETTGLLDQGFDMANLGDAGYILKYFTTLQASRLGLWPALNSEYLNHKNLKSIAKEYLQNAREIYDKVGDNLNDNSLEQVIEPKYIPINKE